MNIARVLIVLLVGGLGMQQASADSLQCGDDLIDVGANVYDLLQRCGEPSAREGDQWIYDQGSGDLKMIVRVSEDLVQSIQPESSETP